MKYVVGYIAIGLSMLLIFGSMLQLGVAANASTSKTPLDSSPSSGLTQSISGHATRGDIFCADSPKNSGKFGTGIGFAIIDFSAAKAKGGESSGIWRIVIDPSVQVPGIIEGKITGVHVGAHSYRLEGIETTDTISDCGILDPPPTNIRIYGKCGEGVTIHFLSEQKREVATFPLDSSLGTSEVICKT